MEVRMRTPRIVALALASAAAFVALAAPWRHYTRTPLCILEPCRPDEPAIFYGWQSGGVFVALLALAALIALAVWRDDAAQLVGGAALAAAAVVAAFAPVPNIFLFAEEGPPGWGVYASMALCALGGLVAVAAYCARFASSAALSSSK